MCRVSDKTTIRIGIRAGLTLYALKGQVQRTCEPWLMLIDENIEAELYLQITASSRFEARTCSPPFRRRQQKTAY